MSINDQDDSNWAGLTGESSKFRALNVLGPSRNSGQKQSRMSANSIDQSDVLNAITPKQINLNAARMAQRNRFDFNT
jgi:hypothetical protein